MQGMLLRKPGGEVVLTESETSQEPCSLGWSLAQKTISIPPPIESGGE